MASISGVGVKACRAGAGAGDAAGAGAGACAGTTSAAHKATIGKAIACQPRPGKGNGADIRKPPVVRIDMPGKNIDSAFLLQPRERLADELNDRKRASAATPSAS